MTCCGHCEGVEHEFDRRTARRDLKRLRRRGPSAHTRTLLQALARHGVDGAELLDIGGGVGAVHHELLARGAARATHVDASSAYLLAAREEAERRGHGERVDFVHGDFVELAGGLDDADIVTLDRVICCYPDMAQLVGRSAARARRLYGLVYPLDGAWLQPVFTVANAWFRLKRCGFRIYRHRTADVDAVVRRQGLVRLFQGRSGIWRVSVYGR